MFGSDRPVCLLAGSYGEVYAATVAALPQLSRPQMSDIVAGTAIRTYGLAGRIAELAAATM